MGALQLQPKEVPQFEMPDLYKADIWHITDWEYFTKEKEDRQKRWKARSSITNYNFDFTQCNNLYIREEFKYVLYAIIKNGSHCGTLGEYYDRFKILCRFLEENKAVDSLLDCSVEDFKKYIINNTKNKAVINDGTKIEVGTMEIKVSTRQNRIITFLTYSQKLLKEYHEKDIPLMELDVWTADRINKAYPHLKFETGRQYNFGEIYQDSIKKVAKEFAKFKIHSLEMETIYQYVATLRKFSAWLNENNPEIKKISQLTRKNLRNFFRYLRTNKEISDHTANLTIQQLKIFFETISLLDVDDKPTKVLIIDNDFYFKQTKNADFYTDVELQNMRNIIPKLKKTDGKILFCLMTLGVRISELLELKTKAVIKNEDGSYYLNLSMDKVDREHIKPLTNEVATIILSEIQKNKKRLGHEPEYVFYSERGKVIRLNNLSRRINTVLVRNEVKDKDGRQLQFKSHKFRATVATTMLNAGYGPEATAKALGHKTLESLTSYVHIHDENALKALAPRLEKDDILIRNIFNVDKKPTVVVKDNIATPLCNGFCVRNPEMGACKKANACLSCGLFKPSVEYLNYYCMQLNEVEATIQVAKANDMDLLLEKNLKLKSDLERIIKAVKEQINE